MVTTLCCLTHVYHPKFLIKKIYSSLKTILMKELKNFVPSYCCDFKLLPAMMVNQLDSFDITCMGEFICTQPVWLFCSLGCHCRQLSVTWQPGCNYSMLSLFYRVLPVLALMSCLYSQLCRNDFPRVKMQITMGESARS